MIRTDRLVLRAGRAEDLDALHAIFSDPRAMRYWDRPVHSDLAQTRAFLDDFRTANPDGREEYILDLDGTAIGKAGVWAKPEVGFILHPDHWGRGYVTEALRVILPRAWAKWPDLTHITAEIDPRNASSARVLRRLGFGLDRVEDKNFLYGGTEWCDTGYWSLPRP